MRIQRGLKIGLLFIGLAGLPMLGFWVGYNFYAATCRVKDVRSQCRFGQLELMLYLYHEAHGTFPPTKYQAEPGGPIHSWRVLLVPYTSPYAQEGYFNYVFSQEWNSSNNLRAFVGKPSRYFRIEGDGDVAHYLAIGDDDEWPSKKPLRARLITKGKDRFLLVEDPDSKIHWMEPKY